MIEIHYGPKRLTPSGIIESAWCEVEGVRYEADSAHGSILALCRVLRDAGIPDQPWQVVGRLNGDSVHYTAQWTISRDGRLTEFAPFPVRGDPKSGGSGQSGAQSGPQQPQAPEGGMMVEFW